MEGELSQDRLIPTTWGVPPGVYELRATSRLIPTTWGVHAAPASAAGWYGLIPTTWGVPDITCLSQVRAGAHPHYVGSTASIQ